MTLAMPISLSVFIKAANQLASVFWARSLVGRASLLHSEGREFESPRVHKLFLMGLLNKPSSEGGFFLKSYL